MAAVYLDCSFVSACITDRTDALSLSRRQISREWWEAQKDKHELFVSQEVLNELSSPQFARSKEALELICDVPLLEIDQEVQGVAEVLVKELVMPGPAVGDAVHVAVCSVNDIEYPLSWNVRHLANPNK